MSETANMNVYRKLQLARVLLQNTKLNKSGKNKFAGYEYFELGDFIPAIQIIFEDVGLCGVITYTLDLATLTIYNTEGEGTIEFTSPMSRAELKGATRSRTWVRSRPICVVICGPRPWRSSSMMPWMPLPVVSK
jgi:hypothetical protein